MFRLSAPTMRTFAIAGPAIVLGILSWLDVFGLGIDADVAYWLTAGGAVFLMIGNLFNKL
jgi:hypothetical protein